jgi:acyl carrier protein
MTSQVMDKESEIKDTIRQFIIETTYTPSEKIKNETLIFVKGIFDSMGFISLINFIEEQFTIKTEDNELLEENFESIDAIASFVNRKLQ